jgi:hypothetical protein
MQSEHEIWTCVADENGAVSELRDAQDEAAFHSLL